MKNMSLAALIVVVQKKLNRRKVDVRIVLKRIFGIRKVIQVIVNIVINHLWSEINGKTNKENNKVSRIGMYAMS
jgi:preprotein translocase subunit Sec63